MKISDKEKGINHNLYGWTEEEQNEYYDYLATQEQEPEEETDYVLEMIQKNEQAQIEWEKQGEKNLAVLLDKQRPTTNRYKTAKSSYEDKKAREAKKQGVTVSTLKEYPPFEFTPKTNFIGERIEYLMSENNQEISEFCLNIGISRSSMHRYIKGSHLPSEKALKKIIDGLYVSVADFCYEPDDFEKWKSAFENSSDSNDIFKFKDKMLEQLRINNFTYTHNGLVMRLPNRYFELFRNLIKQSFEVLELIPHNGKEKHSAQKK